MTALLIIATIVDLGLAALLVGISGFVLEGVNGGGPMMPEAIGLIAMICFCVIAPSLAWWLRARRGPAVAIALAPIALAVIVLAVEPLVLR